MNSKKSERSYRTDGVATGWGPQIAPRALTTLMEQITSDRSSAWRKNELILFDEKLRPTPSNSPKTMPTTYDCSQSDVVNEKRTAHGHRDLGLTLSPSFTENVTQEHNTNYSSCAPDTRLYRNENDDEPEVRINGRHVLQRRNYGYRIERSSSVETSDHLPRSRVDYCYAQFQRQQSGASWNCQESTIGGPPLGKEHQDKGQRNVEWYTGAAPWLKSCNHGVVSDIDVPSVVDSETSSIEHYSGDDMKIAASPSPFSRKYSNESRGDIFDSSRSLLKTHQAGPFVFPSSSPQYESSAIKSIEVSPGEFLRLRGAEETWAAIMFDFYMPCACICCNLTLFCIQDAAFVLCPDCRVVSSMDGAIFGRSGGVGLGFKIEDLARWQDDIKRDRRDARKIM